MPRCFSGSDASPQRFLRLAHQEGHRGQRRTLRQARRDFADSAPAGPVGAQTPGRSPGIKFSRSRPLGIDSAPQNAH